ncbi:MAG: chloride channel protein [Dokdonella sp.]|uniref:chloride channel protein n=1 Tax=Dokdonella sp. TaxID=2291710 RepID=UPI003267C75F
MASDRLRTAWTRYKALRHNELFAPAQWKRRIALWSGGILVGVAAIVFARGSDLAFAGFERVVAISPWLPLLLTPAVFAGLAWLTLGALKSTRGSGIPQVIAAIEVEDTGFRARLLSLPVAAGKMLLTLVALAGGASIGREGPTVHVGAGLMLWLGRRFGYTDPKILSRFILAGGGAGIAAAFNTPLAGVVFAIEELAGTYEHRFSGIVLTAVIFAGVVSLGVSGNYAYFGKVDAILPLGQGWLAVALCGVCGGIGGGLFARLILLDESGVLGRIATLRQRAPIRFAAACGLTLAVLGVFSGSAIYGTGYAQAHALVQATHDQAATFGLLKLAANTLSYWAGIPGGIFSPALAVGAGMGNTLASLLGGTDPKAVVLLGMAAFLAGVTQAPLTAAVISLELTANQSLILPIMAVCLLSRAFSTLACPTPIYRAFASRLVEQRQSPDAPVSAGPQG